MLKARRQQVQVTVQLLPTILQSSALVAHALGHDPVNPDFIRWTCGPMSLDFGRRMK